MKCVSSNPIFQLQDLIAGGWAAKGNKKKKAAPKSKAKQPAKKQKKASESEVGRSIILLSTFAKPLFCPGVHLQH